MLSPFLPCRPACRPPVRQPAGRAAAAGFPSLSTYSGSLSRNTLCAARHEIRSFTSFGHEQPYAFRFRFSVQAAVPLPRRSPLQAVDIGLFRPRWLLHSYEFPPIGRPFDNTRSHQLSNYKKARLTKAKPLQLARPAGKSAAPGRAFMKRGTHNVLRCDSPCRHGAARCLNRQSSFVNPWSIITAMPTSKKPSAKRSERSYRKILAASTVPIPMLNAPSGIQSAGASGGHNFVRQCTDERVNLVTKDLFQKYRAPAIMQTHPGRFWNRTSGPPAFTQ